jgi:hypothetical protein
MMMSQSLLRTFAVVVALITLSMGLAHAAAPKAPPPPPSPFGPAEVTLDGAAGPAASMSVCGFRLVARDAGPQVAVLEPAAVIASLQQNEEAGLSIPIRLLKGPFTVSAQAALVEGERAEVSLSLDGKGKPQVLQPGRPLRLEAIGIDDSARISLRMKAGGAAVIHWSSLRVQAADRTVDVAVTLPATTMGIGPPAVLPPLRPAIEQALVEWDWRMQDGIGTPREPSTYAAAVEQTLHRGDSLLADLRTVGVALPPEAAQWEQLRSQWQALSAAPATDPSAWESLWRRVHALRRRIALSNPLAQVGPLALVKHVPAMFSHQLTQYEGKCARPGGGVFVLERPGQSMQCRQLAAGTLPLGNYEHLDVSWDGKRILFAYCHAETTPRDREEHLERHYHLYEVQADGSGFRQLTDGPYDDFSPRYLPDGNILFLSTRRGGFHRCGRGPCNVFTMALCKADGSNPHPISFHETHEWDPAVLNDGRIIYTRWDYVDRHAVHYQQLWSARPDGSDVRIYYGNNTLNPVGVWEARPIPGSPRVMATAAAHHAMSAGSIILLDTARGIDGLDPITRLTPDALFPESEVPVLPSWYAPVGVTKRPDVPTEQRRWPGHCYKSPYPLSEKYFLASYSHDALIGEPSPNPANMFGLYLVDAFGNKELLYRDLNFCSLWAMPIRPRPLPNAVPSVVEPSDKPEGTFVLQDVHLGWPPLPQGVIKRLRVVQVLPKSTPHANSPTVGLPNASPGRQVLGTVPVEPDGSACFRAPSGIALAFQALDEHGQAVQIMRSLTYLQPGETSACVGCHEPRTTASSSGRMPLALSRPPSVIQPGPDGSKPFSYPILVQPVLDKKCVSCHNPQKPEGKVVLTGEPQGRYTVSYNALGPLVPYSAWGSIQGNSEPASTLDRFGARGSKLMKLLLAGHQKVVLTPEEIERLVTWMDTNVLFYGTFDPADQSRQQRGERIKGPAIE